jgi:amidase
MIAITELEATGIVAGLARREFSAREVTEAFLGRVSTFNAVNAIVTLNRRALDEAAESDRRLRAGSAVRPLEGVPFVVKDVVPTQGLRTTYGSLLFERHTPSEDAVTVERLRAAGAILLGKTNTPEFATDLSTTNKIFGLTRNPVNLNVSAGGSSGGTAAAVAADMAPIGIGTDHGGSIRIPAAWCGITGLRPSPGRVPKYPDEYGWDTLVAHVQGPMARTVADVGLMLAVLASQDDRDPSSLPDPSYDYTTAARLPAIMSGRRVAYCADLGGGACPRTWRSGTACRRRRGSSRLWDVMSKRHVSTPPTVGTSSPAQEATASWHAMATSLSSMPIRWRASWSGR